MLSIFLDQRLLRRSGQAATSTRPGHARLLAASRYNATDADREAAVRGRCNLHIDARCRAELQPLLESLVISPKRGHGLEEQATPLPPHVFVHLAFLYFGFGVTLACGSLEVKRGALYGVVSCGTVWSSESETG